MSKPPIPAERTCTAPSCSGQHYAKGYCKKHYTQALRHGALTPDRERGIVRQCRAPGCERTDTVDWHCRKHARQIRVHDRLTPELEHVMGREGCSVARCEFPHRAKGFCATHYNAARWLKLAKKTPRRSSRKAVLA